MNIDPEILKQTGEAIKTDAERIRNIMDNMPPEKWAAAIASDEAKKTEVRTKIAETEEMTILGVSNQKEEGRHI
jgi:hypothetical protein